MAALNLPPELREVLDQRRVVLVAGAGCGALHGQPGWRARLEALAAALPIPRAAGVRAMIERGVWGTALVAARDRLGEQAAQVVAGLTAPPPAELPPSLAALAAAPWRAVVTTGFDETWARLLTETGAAPVVLCAGERIIKPAPNRRVLIHALGRAARPESLCLAPGDLQTRVTDTGLENFLRELARAASFLYVGFQPGDPDLEWLAGRVLGPAARERPHFTLVTGRTATSSGTRGAFGLRPVVWSGSPEEGMAALAAAAVEAAAPGASVEPATELGTAELELAPAVAPPPTPLAAQSTAAPPSHTPGVSPAPRTPVAHPPRTPAVSHVAAVAPAPPRPSQSVSAVPSVAPLLRPSQSVPAAPSVAPVRPSQSVPAVPTVAPARPSQSVQAVAPAPPSPSVPAAAPAPIVPAAATNEDLRAEIDRATAEERWVDASDGLARLAARESTPAARASLLHARALVLKDTLQDRAAAIVALEEALEADPSFVAAWDALEPLHRGGGDPAALRRCYARALTRLGKSAAPALALRLWNGLAEVSWRSLGDHATAVAAFEAARTLNPADEGPERALAALYLKLGAGAADRAIVAHQGLAARAPDEADPYRVLERLWIDEPAPEKAVWATAVLAQLGHTSDHRTREVVQIGRPAALARPLTEPLREALGHPEEDRVLTTLFTVLAPSLIALAAEGDKAFPPKGAEPLPPVDAGATRPTRAGAGLGTGAFAGAALAHAAHGLGLAAPSLFLVDAPRRPISVRLRAGWPTVRPALLLDRRHAETAPEADLLHELVRTVALLRAPWLLRFADGDPLTLGLRAAYALMGAELPGRGSKRDVARVLDHLRDARPDVAQEQVAALASELDHRPEPPDLARWQAAVELSAARTALAVTGDLDAAVRAANAETARPGGLTPAERVKDLLAFAISDEHFGARAALGLDDSAAA